jgi:hypothetical protein
MITIPADEKTFWADLHDKANTFMVDTMNKLPTQHEKCGNCGGKHEMSKCRRNAPRMDTSPGLQAGGICCDWCTIRGNIK